MPPIMPPVVVPQEQYRVEYRKARAYFEKAWLYKGWDLAMCELWDRYAHEKHYLKIIESVPPNGMDFCRVAALWSLYTRNCCQRTLYDPEAGLPF